MARDFVEHTGVHLFAPSVGNIHGMRASGFDPDLDIARIREIRDVLSVPLVLHGASGNSPEDIRASIDAGISMVHVSTELRRAWREGMETTLKEDAHEVAPYKLTKRSEDMIYRLVSLKLNIMGW
jgi:fructose/tagatose bisphosphate aldolase